MTSSGGPSGGQAQATDANERESFVELAQEAPNLPVESQRIWDAMAFFHALSDLVSRIQQNAPTWDFSNMSALQDLSSTLCVNLVSTRIIRRGHAQALSIID